MLQFTSILVIALLAGSALNCMAILTKFERAELNREESTRKLGGIKEEREIINMFPHLKKRTFLKQLNVILKQVHQTRS